LAVEFAVEFAAAFVADAAKQVRVLLGEPPQERSLAWEADYAWARRYHERAQTYYQEVLTQHRLPSAS
jgi:hypothetical protein